MENLEDILKDKRFELDLTMEEVSYRTGIPIKYLKALENADYIKLPAQVYVIGFLKKLAALYKVQQHELLQLYKYEADKYVQDPKLYNSNQIVQILKGWSITPTFISVVVGGLIVLAVLFWLIWQVAGINTSPILEVFEPKQGEVVQESILRIKGKTDSNAKLSVNGDNVFVDREGGFETNLTVSGGQLDLKFVAMNKLGKSTTKNLTVIVSLPENSQNTGLEDTDNGVIIELSVDRDLPISLTIDGDIQPTEIFTPGTVKKIQAKREIILLTPDAGSTRVGKSGQTAEILGRMGEIKTVTFSAQ